MVLTVPGWTLRQSIGISAREHGAQVLKGIVGQAAFQLAVMYVLVFQGAPLFHIPPASEQMGLPSVQNTIVFNAFVWMQLFNQVAPCPVLRSAIAAV